MQKSKYIVGSLMTTHDVKAVNEAKSVTYSCDSRQSS